MSVKRRILIVLIAALAVGAIAYMIINETLSGSGLHYYGSEITFLSDHNQDYITNAALTYDLDQLKSKLKQITDQHTVHVYSDPAKTDYIIAAKLGFNPFTPQISPSSPTVPANRVYKDRDKWLSIDDFGSFAYISGVKKTSFAFPLSDEEAIAIAKKFLSQYNLLNESIVFDSIHDTSSSYSEEEGTTVLSRTVHFSQITDGVKTMRSQFIGVEINGNGEVLMTQYYVRKFKSQYPAELISLNEAFERINSGKIFVQMSSYMPKELIFEDVTLSYYEKVLDGKNIILQPVYVFSGTSVSIDGRSKPFSITVQANKIDAR